MNRVTTSFEAHSSPAGYIVLAGIWIGLGILFAVLEYWKPECRCWLGALFSFAIASLWVAWLSGFRLRVSDGDFEYRNGFYQTQRVAIRDIEKASSNWIEWRVLWRRIKVPRMVVQIRDANPIIINTKPFSRSDLATLRSIFVMHTS